MARVLGLAFLGLVVFVVSAVATHVALLLFAGTVLSGSCGPNCYTDVYLGPEFYLVTLGVAGCVAALVVRRVARRGRRP